MCLVTQSYPTLRGPMDCSPLCSSFHGDSPGKNTRVGCHAFLQGIFTTQGSNPGLLHCKWILYQLSYQESTNNILIQTFYCTIQGPTMLSPFVLYPANTCPWISWCALVTSGASQVTDSTSSGEIQAISKHFIFYHLGLECSLHSPLLPVNIHLTRISSPSVEISSSPGCRTNFLFRLCVCVCVCVCRFAEQLQRYYWELP